MGETKEVLYRDRIVLRNQAKPLFSEYYTATKRQGRVPLYRINPFCMQFGRKHKFPPVYLQCHKEV